jgi:hypothetical protein
VDGPFVHSWSHYSCIRARAAIRGWSIPTRAAIPGRSIPARAAIRGRSIPTRVAIRERPAFQPVSLGGNG